MSLTSKITLASAITFSIGIISYVHYKQHTDRQELHRGVLKDIEMRARRKAENVFYLQRQADFTKQLQKTNENSTDVT